MSSVVLTILYHLTDQVIAKPFPRQISVYFLPFPVLRTRGIKPLFAQEFPYRLRFFSLIITDFQRSVGRFFGYPFLKKRRPDLLSALCPLTALDKILCESGVIQISERAYILYRLLCNIGRAESLQQFFPE